MKISSKYYLLGTILSLLLVCFCAYADPIEPRIPAEVTLNKDAGRGNFIFVTLRLGDGEELPFVMDTGSPGTVFDKSLEPKLGKRLAQTSIDLLGGEQKAAIYKEPKIYLGSAELMTGSYVVTIDLKKLPIRADRPIKGILGMDCLKNYCLQLDFATGKLRFLHSNSLNVAELGKAFPLVASQNQEDTKPYIHQAGLLGGTCSNSIIDTGCNIDCLAEAGAIKQHASGSYSGGFITRIKHFLVVEGMTKNAVALPNCVWDGNTYTNIIVGRAPSDSPSWVGLRFLTRHLVTFDFPSRIIYLKQVSIGPLSEVKVE